MDVFSAAVAALALVVILIAVLYILLMVGSKSPAWGRRTGEDRFVDGTEVGDLTNEHATVHLSVVIPAYNEAKRIPGMLEETHAYLMKQNYTFEMIVVDDGSKDNTSDIAQAFAESHEGVFVLRLAANRGKGGAVRMGMLSARGEYLLMADADAATDINDLTKVLARMYAIQTRQQLLSSDSQRKGYATASADAAKTAPNSSSDGHTPMGDKGGLVGVVVGSRAHLADDSVAKRSIFRTILMYGFHFLVAYVGGISDVRDTQCGFKLFTRRSAQVLFHLQHIERWAFDVELLYLAKAHNFPLAEVPVNWTEIDGSKVDPVADSIQMAKDLVRIRALYMFRIWALKPTLG